MINSQASLGEDSYKTPDESNGDNFHNGILNQFNDSLNYDFFESLYTQKTLDAIAEKYTGIKVGEFLSHSYKCGFDNEAIIYILKNDLESIIFDIKYKAKDILEREKVGEELLQLAIEIQNKVLRIY